MLGIDHRFTIGANANANSKLKFTYTGGPPNLANLTAIATAVHAAFVTNLKPWLANTWFLNEVVVQDLANPAAPVGIWSGSEAGSRTTTPGDAAQCVVVSYPITRRYRGGHPRGYWPLLGASDLTSPGTWNGTILANLQTAFAAYVAAIIGITGGGVTITAQCSVSYYSGPVYPATAAGVKQHASSAQRLLPVVDVVSTPVCRTRPGTQRRRLKRA